MSQVGALERLGLAPGASADEVEEAYKSRTRPLKMRLLGATRPEAKAALRERLRELVCERAAALGGAPPPRWVRPAAGPASSFVLESLERTLVPDAAAALAFFDVDQGARPDQVRAAYDLRSRALKRRYARAADTDEMDAIRAARADLRRIRDLALGTDAPRTESVGFEETITGPAPGSAQRRLGLDADASEEAVRAAYLERARPLRAHLLLARSDEERQARLEELRAVRRARDALLSRPRP